MKFKLFLAFIVFYAFGLSFDIKSIAKVADDSYIVGFSDDLNTSDIDKNLKLDGVKFKSEKLVNGEFLLTLDKNITNLNLKFKEYEYKYTSDFKSDMDTKSIDIDPKAKSMLLQTPKYVALDGGQLGIRIYLKNYINATKLKKFIKINGIGKFNITDISYLNDPQSEGVDKDTYYYIDIISDEFKPQSEYDLTILSGFGDEYNAVKENQKFSIKMGDIAPFVAFLDDKPYISSLGYVNISSANVSQAKVVIKKLMDQNYLYFLNLNENNLERLTKEVATKIYEIGGVKNEIKTHSLKLDFKGFGDGVYIVSINYSDKSVSKAIYLSDIAINVKIANDEVFVFTNRLSQNSMLSGANIKIYSTKNELLATGATNDEGVFWHSKKDIHKDVGSVVASIGKEQSFIIINDDNRLNKEAYRASKNLNENVDAYVYFASNIIRPNESIKGAIYLRDSKFKPLKDMPLRVVFKDPQGKNILELNQNSDKNGVLVFDKQINSDFSGSFLMQVIYADKVIKNENFFVESFVPSRLLNSVFLKKDSFLKDEAIDVKISSNYLFGLPASGFNADVELLMYDDEYKDQRYKGYKFINTTINNLNSNTSYKRVVLDENGSANLKLDIALKNDVASIVRGVVKFDINDDGKMVTGLKDLTIYPYKSVVGLNLSSDFIYPDDTIKIRAVVLDAISKDKKSEVLKFQVKRLVWDYVREFDSGSYNLKWFKSYEDIDEFYKQSGEFDYKFSQNGEYVIVATDLKSGASSSFDIRVSGYEYSTLAPTKEISKVNIKLNAKEYKKGDEISADISSVIKDGLALVTFESNGIKDYRLVYIKNHSASVKFKIDFDFLGGYISANIYKIADRALTPFRASSKAYVKARYDDRKLDLSLSYPKIVKSSDTIKVGFKTIKNADLILFVADLGVLNLTSHKSPDPLRVFNKNINDSVFDYDIYSKLTGFKPTGTTLNFGGGLMRAMMSKHSSPVDSKNITSFVKMIRLKSDENGNAFYEFSLPNGFNSAIRLDAIVLDEGGFGIASGEVLVKDDLIIKPSVLSYLLQGDEINAKLRLINTTNFDKNISLNLNSTKNLKVDIDDKNINLKPLQNMVLNLKLSALNLGRAELNITALSNNDRYLSNLKLDIISAYPVSTYANSMSIKGKKSIKVSDEFNSVIVDASVSPISLLQNISKNLISYPYGCLEQRSSRLLALLYSKPSGKFEIDDRQRFITLGINDISKMQKQNGTFGYWSEFSDVNDFSFIYSTDVLLSLKDSGYDLPSGVKNKALNALNNTTFSDTTNELYAMYILSRYNKLNPSRLNSAYDRKIYKNTRLDSYLMAASLKNLGYKSEAKAVLNGIKDISKPKKYSDENFGSYIRDSAFALYIHSLNFKKDDLSDSLANELIKNINEVGSTQERAFVLRALSEYFKDSAYDVNFSIKFKDESLNLKSGSKVVISPKNGEFEIIPSGDNELFVSISSSANAKLEKKSLKESKALDIRRSFVDKDANEISLDNLKMDQLIYSKIYIGAKSPIRVGVLNEMISPCFEAVNEEISGLKRPDSLQTTINIQHKILKDDRVLHFYDLNANESGFIYTPYRVVLSGKCMLPATISENMYNEVQSDYDLSQYNFIVK